MPKPFEPGFECNRATDRGVRFTYANNYTVSVQWAPHNYISKRGFSLNDAPTYSSDAEVAVMGPDGAFVRGWPHGTEYDDVAGWLKPDQVLEIMVWAAAQPVT